MACVTYLPRLLPFLAPIGKPDGRQTSDTDEPGKPSRTAQVARLSSSWLGYVPTAVLSAMLLPAVLISDGRLNFSPDNLFLWAALPTLFVAWKTRSLFGAVVTGIAFVAAARQLCIA
jgi:branched-subunit amino acid transport protein